jgi:hypothetical protein
MPPSSTSYLPLRRLLLTPIFKASGVTLIRPGRRLYQVSYRRHWRIQRLEFCFSCTTSLVIWTAPQRAIRRIIKALLLSREAVGVPSLLSWPSYFHITPTSPECPSMHLMLAPGPGIEDVSISVQWQRRHWTVIRRLIGLE